MDIKFAFGDIGEVIQIWLLLLFHTNLMFTYITREKSKIIIIGHDRNKWLLVFQLYLPISFNNPLISILKVSSSSFSDINIFNWSIMINLIILQNEYTIPNIDEFQKNY